ncbi:DUF4255 domain-containing protein [Desulfobacter curvatus]|uniref:DUF4255 domain-containing protein n=1 Tax=Desulfobacter curvatus TaxID=2290 RepID=UPI0003823438|nr:DUF4255 domain-containing protein [Desulfobacter curvatus]
MINNVLELVTTSLNRYLKIRFEFSEHMVVLSSLVEPDGTMVSATDNKLVISLVGIERDTCANTSPVVNTKGEGGASAKARPGIRLNLYIMVAANFSAGNYNEGLKILSQAIGFFQKHPVFTRHNIPDMDPKIGKLIFSIENMSIRDLSSLWSVISNKYLPSVLYKIQVVAIDTEAVVQRTLVIEGEKVQSKII